MKAARSQRGGIEDRWYKRENGQRVPSVNHGNVTRWRARYVGADGHEHTRHFSRKIDAQQWLDHETAKLVTGLWVDPKTSKLTVAAWCTTWLDGYRTRKPSTVRMAEVHIAKIAEQFAERRLDSLRPSDIKSWLSGLKAAGCVCAARSTGADPV